MNLDVSDAAQGERDLSARVGTRQFLGLTRGQFEGRRVALRQLLAVARLDQLTNRQHAHVLEERLGYEFLALAPNAVGVALHRARAKLEAWLRPFVPGGDR